MAGSAPARLPPDAARPAVRRRPRASEAPGSRCLLVVLALSLADLPITVTACAPAEAPDAPAIASVLRQQCGRCHTLPQAGTHSRAYLQQALGPHHERVHLTDPQWAEMIDYLAAARTGS